MSGPECLVCNQPADEWGICPRCHDAAGVSMRQRDERVRARVDGRCLRCGSAFPGHRCAMR